MRKMFIKYRLLGILAAVVALAGCKQEEKIVANFHSLAEPFFVQMSKAAQDEAATLGVKVVVVDAQANSSKQTADVQNAVTQGVSGIIIAPTDSKALAPAVNDIIAAGIPLVSVDRRVEGASQPVPHVGADNVAGGRIMVELVMRAYPDGANIVFLMGQPGSSSAIDRAKGVHEAVAASNGKYRIVAEQTANWARDQGLTVAQNILTSLTGNPPDAIIAANDDMALGATEAIVSMGLRDAGIKVVGFDATPEALAKIRRGEMYATVEQDPSRQIRVALGMLHANITRQEPMESVAISPLPITIDNLDAAARIDEAK